MKTERQLAGEEGKGSPRYRRVLLKLSGEAFAPDGGYGLDFEVAGRIATEVGDVVGLGVQVGVVVGGGNILRGAEAEHHGMDRPTADYMGMLATVINGLALRDSLERSGVPTRLQTAIAMHEIAEPYIRSRALRHLEKGRVVIFAAGSGNPYFSTDTTAAHRALEVGAEAILVGKRVAGVFTSDPLTDPGAAFLPELTYMQVLERDLKVMDGTAIAMCKEYGIPIHVFNLLEPGNIERVVRGAEIGTIVH